MRNPRGAVQPDAARAMEELPEDARKILAWLRERYAGGRPRVYSLIEIARGVFGRSESPGAIFDPATSARAGHSLYAPASAPTIMFDPADWPRVTRSVALLEQHGLIEQARLPQGDRGYRLSVGEIHRAAESARV